MSRNWSGLVIPGWGRQFTAGGSGTGRSSRTSAPATDAANVSLGRGCPAAPHLTDRSQMLRGRRLVAPYRAPPVVLGADDRGGGTRRWQGGAVDVGQATTRHRSGVDKRDPPSRSRRKNCTTCSRRVTGQHRRLVQRVHARSRRRLTFPKSRVVMQVGVGPHPELRVVREEEPAVGIGLGDEGVPEVLARSGHRSSRWRRSCSWE